MIETTVNSASHSGGGTIFPIPFRFDRPDWLTVTLTNGTTGTIYLLTPGTDGDYEIIRDDEGTRLVLHEALPEDHVLDIRRSTPPLQELHLVPNKPIFSTDLETALDRMAMALQDREPTSITAFTNTLLFPLDEPVGFSTQLPPAIERRGKILGFHPANGEMELQTIDTLSTTVAADAVGHIQEAAEQARTSSITAINTAYHQLFDDEEAFFYRHTEGGLVLGKVNDSEHLNPGENSLTIQPDRSAWVNIATGQEAIALGKNSRATGLGAIAAGLSARASGEKDLAIGHLADAGGEYGTVAIGYNSDAQGPASLAIGTFARTDPSSGNTGNISLGAHVNAAGLSTVSIGYLTSTSNWWSVAVGMGSDALGYGSTAVGVESGASSYMSCAYGYKSTAPEDFSTAVGYQNSANGDYATAIGSLNHASGNNSTAVGNMNNVAGGEISDSTAVGSNNIVGIHATALGTGNDAGGDSATAIGRANLARFTKSTAIGHGSEAGKSSATAIGQAKAIGTGTTAIGYGAITNTDYATEIRVKDSTGTVNSGSRLRLTGSTRGVALSYIQNATKPGQASGDWGTEGNSYVLPRNMLTFRRDPGTGKLHIDVSVPTSPGATTFVVRTAELNLA